MIVFINVEENSITIIDDKKVHVFDLSSVDSISSIIGDNVVNYVTSVDQVEGYEIVKLISSLDYKETKEIKDNGKRYLRSLASGTFHVNGAGPVISFSGPGDIKDISLLPKDLLSLYPVISSLINSKKLEIIDENKKQKIIKEISNKNKSKPKKSSMLINEKVDSFINRKESIGSDAIAIDLESDDKLGDIEIISNIKKLGLSIEEEGQVSD